MVKLSIGVKGTVSSQAETSVREQNRETQRHGTRAQNVSRAGRRSTGRLEVTLKDGVTEGQTCEVAQRVCVAPSQESLSRMPKWSHRNAKCRSPRSQSREQGTDDKRGHWETHSSVRGR